MQIKFLEMKPTMCEMKNTLARINGITDITEEKISGFEDTAIETSPPQKKNKEKRFFFLNDQDMYELQRQLKSPNIYVIGAFIGGRAENNI